MAIDRRGLRDRRAFRPALDGALESRQLMSARITARVAFGGQISEIRDTDGERYNVVIAGGGVVHAKPMSGGRVELIVDNSTPQSELTINPVNARTKRGLAHNFPPGAGHGDGLLHIGAVQVNTGKIGYIEGYKTADLSGPINIAGNTVVTRIAFFRLLPGAMIATGPGSDLNQLEVFNDVNLSGGTGIDIGRDLNVFNVGGNVSLSGGSSIIVGRDIGLTAQAAVGTGMGGQGGTVQGNFTVDDGSTFTIGRSLQNLFLVNGTFTGASNVSIPFGGSSLIARGGIS